MAEIQLIIRAELYLVMIDQPISKHKQALHTNAIVARGQRAWGRIKATAAEQRELWREVGEALLVGRRLHKSDKLFGQWIKEHGFGDMDRRYRADSMWLAEVSRGGTVEWGQRSEESARVVQRTEDHLDPPCRPCRG